MIDQQKRKKRDYNPFDVPFNCFLIFYVYMIKIVRKKYVIDLIKTFLLKRRR